jgi:2'-5' RNA ligase
VRLFLAINVDPEVRRAVVEASAPLRAVAPKLGWVREPNVHLTLKFLGDHSESLAAEVTAAMQRVAERHRPVDVELGGVGAFPNFRRPRVVWIGVSPAPKLELLHHDVECAAKELGFSLDGRPFRPHLTLARVKPRAVDAVTLRALDRAAKQIDYTEEIVINSIDLMQSELGPGGSRYRLLSSAQLPFG